MRLQHEQAAMREKIRDNGEKIKQNKVLPYLVGNVVEVRLSQAPEYSTRVPNWLKVI
jgi:ATP-dependent 26S proteasome regulatory subunit